MQKTTLFPAAVAVTTPKPSLALPETGFLRQQQVLMFIPFSKSTLWRRVQERSFPEPLKLSARVTVWRVEDIGNWIREQGRGIGV